METYSQEEIRKLQLIEVDALKAIIAVCDKLSIEYFLIGGTCLGAIRHDGFIPWDDDIDVGMTRDDYNRFLLEAPRLLDERFFLQTPFTEKNAQYSYSKLRVNGTTFMEYSNRKVIMHQGVYCDIFPFDEVPDDDVENIKQFREVTRLNNLLYYRQVPDVASAPDSLKEWFRYIIRYAYHILLKVFVRKEKIIKKVSALAERYNGTGQSAMACLNFPVRKKEYILISDLYPLSKHVFEGIEANVPNNTDVYLTTHYGDWRSLPPEKDRVGHRPFRIEL